MDDVFIENLSHILESEGGYSNRPKCEDTGGPTKYGITQEVYSAWLENRGALSRNVLGLRVSEAEEIYYRQYWKPICGPDLPPGVGLAIFDFAVHSGVSLASRKVQKILRVPADGIIGQITLQEIKNFTDREKLINRICDDRLAFIKKLSTFKANPGWEARIKRVRENSIQMLNAPHSPARKIKDSKEAHRRILAPDLIKASGGKAVASSMKIYNMPVAKTTGALVATTPFLALADTVKDYLAMPYGGCYLIFAAVIAIIFYYVTKTIDENIV